MSFYLLRSMGKAILVVVIALLLTATSAAALPPGPSDENPDPPNLPQPGEDPDPPAPPKTRKKRVPLVVIDWDPHRPEHEAPPISSVREMVGGEMPSIKSYFDVNSLGKFTISEAAVLGWYSADKPADHYWEARDEGDSNGDGWVSGHSEKRTEAVLKADADFDFARYDKNKNGRLSSNELNVLVAIPQNGPFGSVRGAVSREYPTPKPLVVDGVVIETIAEWYVGAPINLPVAVHELSHLMLGLPDMYGEPTGHRAGPYSLMDVTYSDSHIDAYHKLKLGWAKSRVVKKSGIYDIKAAAGSNEVLILRDPRNRKEFFLVENRYRTTDSYDSRLPDQGLAIWHIIEDPDIYENAPPPEGVDEELWDSLGRVGRGIRLVRPIHSVPPNNRKSLWDGLDSSTGYDLLSDDPDAEHVSLRWADGTPSGFAVSDISRAGMSMSARITVPGTAFVRTHSATGSGFEISSGHDLLAGFWDAQKWRVGDFNGDGLDDLVNVYDRGGKARVWVHLARAGGGFEARSSLQSLAGFWDAQKWRVGDFNGDDLASIHDR